MQYQLSKHPVQEKNDGYPVRAARGSLSQMNELGYFGNIWIRSHYFPKAGVNNDGGHKHNFDHTTLLARGKIRVRVPGFAPKEFTAPTFIIIKKEHKHEITALEDDTLYYCVFAVRDIDGNVTDIYSGDNSPFGISPDDNNVTESLRVLDEKTTFHSDGEPEPFDNPLKHPVNTLAKEVAIDSLRPVPKENTSKMEALGYFGNIWIRSHYYDKAGMTNGGGHKHHFDHTTLLVNGSIKVEVEGYEPKIFTAPTFVIVKKEHSHFITALEDDTLYYCVFALRDEDGGVTDIYSGDNSPYNSIPDDDETISKLEDLDKKTTQKD
jgi:hypothetical protein